MNEQTIELQIKSKAQEAKSSVDSLVKGLTNVENVLTNIYLELGNIEKKSSTGVKQTSNSMKELKKTTDTATTSVSKLNKAFSLGGAYLGVKRLTNQFLGWMNLSVDRTEQLNLFNVVFKNIEKNGVKTFSELGKSATQFQYKLNEAFGTNMTETLKYQGLFQSMGQNVGIPDTYSSLMSETMTKLTYDLASLYNKQESVVAEALRAGVYAGQTKPLRGYGIDVTQTSMQPILDELGITDRSVKQMSQAEKEILRYIATLRQAKVAMGDMANTIESPSNQLKVFKQQLVEAKVALSNLFMGVYSRILPYANAFLMVIKEVSKAIADMFGIKISDYNTGIASQEDAYEDLEDSVEGATGAVKELKRQTLGFDQIHNINEDKDNGNGGNLTGGIDQRLLDAIKGYDNGMDRVRMKATEIRDRIMEWLGFTKEIDPLTNEVHWKLTDTNSTMGKIISSLKDIIKYGSDVIKNVFEIIKKDFDNGAFGKFISSTFQTVANLFKYISGHKNVQNIIVKIIEALLMFKTVKTILKPFVTLWQTFNNKVQSGTKIVTNFAKQLKGTNNYIEDSNGNLKEYNKTIEGHSNVILNADGSINKWQTALSKAKTALEGVVMTGAGLYTLYESMKSIANEGPNVTNVLGGITGALSSIAGFATIGSMFGPVGTAIGIAVGAITTLVTALGTWATENDELSKSIDSTNQYIDEYKSSMQDLADSREKSFSAINTEYGYYEQLFKELQNITDENGKIKQGYEDRAEVITTILSKALGIEISIVDGVIQKYSDLEDSIYDVINAKKAEALLNAYEPEFNEAMKEKTELQKKYNKSVKDTKEAQQEYRNALEKVADYFNLTTDQVEDYYNGILKVEDTHGELRRELNSLSEAYGNKYVQSLEYWQKKLDDSIEAENKAGKALDDNQVVINNYNKALELMAGKHYDSVLAMFNNTVTFNGKTKEENDKKYKEEIELIDKHLKDLESRQDTYSKEEYDALVESYNLQKEALLESKNEANQILDEKNKEIKEKTLEGVNGQLETLRNHKYEFKEASDGNMQLYVDGIATGKPVSEETMSKLVDGTIQKIKDKKMDAETAGKFLVEGVELGIGNKDKQNGVFSSIRTFADNIITMFKKRLGINSPSKEAKQDAIYFLEGFNIGFDNFKNKSINKVEKFSKDIVDSMDFDYSNLPDIKSIDVSKYVNFSDISGSIQNNINANLNNSLAREIGSYIVQAMNSIPIEVELEAHTDEGVVVDRINQKTKQTGVCPINIPIN